MRRFISLLFVYSSTTTFCQFIIINSFSLTFYRFYVMPSFKNDIMGHLTFIPNQCLWNDVGWYHADSLLTLRTLHSHSKRCLHKMNRLQIWNRFLKNPDLIVLVQLMNTLKQQTGEWQRGTAERTTVISGNREICVVDRPTLKRDMTLVWG